MSTIIPANVSALRIVRYDVIDGSVNDAHTIHTEKAADYSGEEWADLVSDAWDNPRAYAGRVVGIAADVTVDNGADFGERVEFLSGLGDPIGALVFEK
jgi:hypothetical protein